MSLTGGVDVATLELRTDATGLRDGQRAMNEFEADGARLEGRAKGIGRAFAEAGKIIAASWVLREVIKNSIEAQNATAQLEAVVRSTGGVAGKSVPELERMAAALQKLTPYEDEAVEGAEALLLTFKSIRGETFDAAVRTTLDLATAMGGDLRGAALQVGKALEDPVRGVTALRRSGVSFTETQLEVIKKLVETGEKAKAQTLILKEMETQFGGSARAARGTLGGAIAYLKNQFGDFFEVSATGSTVFISSINSLGDAIEYVRTNIVEPFFGGIQIAAIDLAVAAARVDLWKARVVTSFDDALGAGGARKRILDFANWIDALPAPVKKLLGLADWLDVGSMIKRAAEGNTQNLVADAQKHLEATIAAAEQAKIELFTGGNNEGPKRIQALTEDLSKAEKEYQHLIRAQEIERDRVAALNNGYRESKTALALVNNEFDRLAALNDNVAKFEGEHLKEMNRLTNQIYDLKRASISLADSLDLVSQVNQDALADTKEAQEKLRDLIAKNAEEDARKLAEPYEEAARAIQSSISSAFERVFEDGENIFRALADSVLSIIKTMVAQIAALLVMDKLGLTKMIEDLAKAKSKEDVKAALPSWANSTAGRIGGSALAGVAIGSALGSSLGTGTGSGVVAALGGAAGGALAGAQIAGPVGAVVGAVGGLVAGLWSHAKKAREAAEKVREAEKLITTDLAARRAAAAGNAKLAEDLRRQAMNEKEIEDARKNKVSQTTINSIRATQAEEALAIARQRAQEAADRVREFEQDLSVRRLRALGDTEGADALQHSIEWENQLRDARVKGFSEEQIEALRAVQALEKEADAKAKLTAASEEAARAFREQAEAAGSLLSRALSLTGRSGEARSIDLSLRQAQEIAEMIKRGDDALALEALKATEEMERIRLNADLQIEALQEQQQTLEDQLKVAQDQLNTQRSTVDQLRRVVESLDDFSRSLAIDPTRSPTDQFAAASAEFERLLMLARGGDQNAAESLPEAARALLEIARENWASSPEFQAVFEHVRDSTAEVANKFRDQLTVEERQLAVLEWQTGQLNTQIQLIANQIGAVNAAANAQIGVIWSAHSEAFAKLRDILNKLIEILTTTDATASNTANLGNEFVIKQLQQKGIDDYNYYMGLLAEKDRAYGAEIENLVSIINGRSTGQSTSTSTNNYYLPENPESPGENIRLSTLTDPIFSDFVPTVQEVVSEIQESNAITREVALQTLDKLDAIEEAVSETTSAVRTYSGGEFGRPL